MRGAGNSGMINLPPTNAAHVNVDSQVAPLLLRHHQQPDGLNFVLLKNEDMDTSKEICRKNKVAKNSLKGT